jgi:hypothetical protein
MFSVSIIFMSFAVIAAGGHAKVTEEPQSDTLVAFALP